jgi:hypothetical protein
MDHGHGLPRATAIGRESNPTEKSKDRLGRMSRRDGLVTRDAELPGIAARD